MSTPAEAVPEVPEAGGPNAIEAAIASVLEQIGVNVGETLSALSDGGAEGREGGKVPEFNLDDPQVRGLLSALLASGSSGGGGGGGGAAPVDPTVSAAAQFYFQLWGIKPPLGYIEGFIGAGHDLFDFMREQLGRPGAAKQQFFRDQYARLSSLLAQAFGRR